MEDTILAISKPAFVPLDNKESFIIFPSWIIILLTPILITNTFFNLHLIKLEPILLKYVLEH